MVIFIKIQYKIDFVQFESSTSTYLYFDIKMYNIFLHITMWLHLYKIGNICRDSRRRIHNAYN